MGLGLLIAANYTCWSTASRMLSVWICHDITEMYGVRQRAKAVIIYNCVCLALSGHICQSMCIKTVATLEANMIETESGTLLCMDVENMIHRKSSQCLEEEAFEHNLAFDNIHEAKGHFRGGCQTQRTPHAFETRIRISRVSQIYGAFLSHARLSFLSNAFQPLSISTPR